MAFESTEFACSAARLTDRCSDQATIIRQAKTENSKNPSAAPTAIKKVPSGSDDFCINGAPEVGGTVGFGYSFAVLSLGFGGRLDPDESVITGRLSDVLVVLVVNAGGFSLEVVSVGFTVVSGGVLSGGSEVLVPFGGSEVGAFSVAVLLGAGAGGLVVGSDFAGELVVVGPLFCARAAVASRASSRKDIIVNLLSFMLFCSLVAETRPSNYC